MFFITHFQKVAMFVLLLAISSAITHTPSHDLTDLSPIHAINACPAAIEYYLEVLHIEGTPIVYSVMKCPKLFVNIFICTLGFMLGIIVYPITLSFQT